MWRDFTRCISRQSLSLLKTFCQILKVYSQNVKTNSKKHFTLKKTKSLKIDKWQRRTYEGGGSPRVHNHSLQLYDLNDTFRTDIFDTKSVLTRKKYVAEQIQIIFSLYMSIFQTFKVTTESILRFNSDLQISFSKQVIK